MGKKLLLCGAILLFLFNAAAYSQNKKASGKVIYASDGSPVVGAGIKVEGTTLGTFSDVDGRFSIDKIPSKATYLQVTFLGVKDVRVKIGEGLTIRMEDDSEALESAVVTGMQKMDRRIFTGATTKVDASDAKLDGMADISRSLEGRAAGVSVQNVSGTFGTAPKIRVRGATSIYGSSKPLWVVDGVIMDDVVDVSADELSSGDANTLISSAIAGLNADDIESFQILKDGSSTSIYGARAMAGVIVVTTKRGHAGSSRISYTGEFTTRLVPSYRDFNIMNSQEQMGVYKELKEKGWLNFSNTYRASSSGVYGKMYQLMNTYDPSTGLFALENTDAAANRYLRAAEYRNTDWFDELFSSNVMRNHSVSLSAGSEKFNVYSSISLMRDPGWYLDSKVDRYTANFNGTYNISRSLSFNMIASASYRRQKAPGTLSQNTDPVSGEVSRDFDINPYSFALNTSRTMDPDEYYTRNYADFNIRHELDNNYMDIDVHNSKYQGELKWKAFTGFELSALGAMKYSSTTIEHRIKDDSNQAEAYRAMDDATIRDRNPWLYTDPDNAYNLPISILPKGGIFRKTDNTMRSLDFRVTGNWNRTFNNTHIVNLFGGMEANEVKRNNTYFLGWGMQYNNGEIPYYIYQFFKKSIEDGSDYYSIGATTSRSMAWFANGTYSYKGRYTLNGTFRYEGTNRLGKTRTARYMPTWNISGSWNVHEEKFFQALEPTLSHLSLKASYSLTGDPGPSSVTNSTVLLQSYSPYRPFTSVQESGIRIESLANSELTYEKKHEINIGVDVGFLDNRINLEGDWYKRNNYDLIGVIRTEGVGGQISKLANVASMRSHGLEFTLSTKNIEKKDFSWNTNFIISDTHTKVTRLDAQSSVMDVIAGNGFAIKGYPVRGLFSYKFLGLASNGVPTIEDQDGNVTTTGSTINFQSQNLDNLKYEGPTDPTTTGSLGNVFRYKGWRLNVFITYSFGNVLRLDPVFRSSYTDLDATPKEFKNRWIMSGDEATTNVPVILTRRQYSTNGYYSMLYNAYNYSTERVAKGDFIRMKEISLSYDFPKNWVNKILKVSDLSLKLQATNLFLIYADKKLNGQDPEFFLSGGVSSPVPKQFTFTVRIGI